MRGTPLQDEHGCLSERGLAVLKRAPMGQAPPELAAHLARCDRCQTRLLSVDPLASGPASPARRAPSLTRWLVLLGVCLGLALLALFAASSLR